MRRFTRRAFLAGAAGALVSSRLWAPAALAQSDRNPATRLILLGTKGPRVGGKGRKNPSTLIVVNGIPYLVDCGYGTSQQLVAAGVPLSALRYIFITHHHSDHNLEYGSVVYNGLATGLADRVDA